MSVPVPERLFLFKLVPPRADFAYTMTDAEQQAMERHQRYWRGLLDQGRVLVYGPVADPEGVWGLGIVRAPGQAEAIDLGNHDPVVQAGIATFETFEILGAITA